MRVPLIFSILICFVLIAPISASSSLVRHVEGAPSKPKIQEYTLFDETDFESPEFTLLEDIEDAFNLGELLLDNDLTEMAEQEFSYALECFFFSGLDLNENILAQAKFFELLQRLSVYNDRINLFREWDEDDDITGENTEESLIEEMVNRNLLPVTIDPSIKHLIEEDILHQKYDFPVYINKQVLTYINYLTTGKKRERVAIGLNRLQKYMELFTRIYQEEGLPTDLIYFGLIESNYSTRAHSRAKAKGIWQFISWTGRKYGLRVDWWVDERSDPEKSTRASCRYIKDLYELFADWYLVLAAYNSGEGRVGRTLKKYPNHSYWDICRKRKLPRETRNYVPAILAAIIVGKNPERFGFSPKPSDPLQYRNVDIPSPTDLRIVAETIGVSLKSLQELNPALRRRVTPPDTKTFTIHIPEHIASDSLAHLFELPIKERLKWIQHPVRRGDNLWNIARKYGVSVSAIKGYNKLRGRNPILRVGQVLLVPLSNIRKDSPRISHTNYQPSPISGKTYRVRSGDTLWGISRRCGLSVNRLKTLNNLSSSRLKIGMLLKIQSNSKSVVQNNRKIQPVSKRSSAESYIVRRGDTLWGISQKSNVSVKQLQKANGLSRTSRIYKGQRLTIPGGKVSGNSNTKSPRIHIVRKGDTLYAIARRYRTNISALKSANRMSGSSIHPGERLVIPN